MCTLQSYKATLSLLNWPQDLEESLLVLELVFIAYLLPRALYVRKHAYPTFPFSVKRSSSSLETNEIYLITDLFTHCKNVSLVV